LIERDTWRIALVFYEEGRFTPSGFIHVRCVLPYFETTEIRPRLAHFSPEVGAGDLDAILAEATAPGVPPRAPGPEA
jgi:hypothetical protein